VVEIPGVQNQQLAATAAEHTWISFPECSMERNRSTGDFIHTCSLGQVGEYGIAVEGHSTTLLCAPLKVIDGGSPQSPTQAGDSARCVTVNGLDRGYLVHIPAGWTSQEPVPVVFVFHGWTVSATAMQLTWEWDEVADLANFLVVYPVGVQWSWNSSQSDPGYAASQSLNESAYVRQMLSDLSTVASIDPKRIYAMGHSQGGMLAYRLACEMSDTFAAIASVAGPMTYRLCQPQQAVSVIHVHGLADEYVPYSGGGGYGSPPVESGIAAWVEFSGCTGSAEVETLSEGVTHTTYAPCEAGTAVELYTIESAGHFRQPPLVMSSVEVIWDFFAAHPKP
jgi:polyhydroxybutyrate depolymerase